MELVLKSSGCVHCIILEQTNNVDINYFDVNTVDIRFIITVWKDCAMLMLYIKQLLFVVQNVFVSSGKNLLYKVIGVDVMGDT